MNKWILVLAPFLMTHVISINSHAFRSDEWTFGSKYDYFKIERREGRYYIGEEKVSMTPFSDFTGLFAQAAETECPTLPKRPDLTVKAKKGDKLIRRNFYIKAKVVSDGKGCIEIGGQGIYYVPLHHNWFTADKKSAINLGTRFSILRDDGKELLNFKKKNGVWENTNPKFFTNWEFFSKFVDAVSSFNIDARVHESIKIRDAQIGFNPHRFTLKTPSKKIIFYKIDENLWAAQLPRVNWLIAVNQWALFGDMDLSLWKDPNFSRLQSVLDKSLNADERKSAVGQLDSFWSKSIRQAFQSIMLDSDESDGIKQAVAKRLRNHPTEDTILVLVKALTKTESAGLQNYISKILKIKNPQGPTISANLDDEERPQQIRAWQTWARTFGK